MTVPDLAKAVLDSVDPRMRAQVAAALEQCLGSSEKVRADQQVVLVGHRAAGKTTLLAPLARLLDRPGVDLDTVLAARRGEPVRTLLERDAQEFRRAEREVFLTLPAGAVVAAGGGFLAHHADLLADRLAVLVPVSFETYRERLLADTTRPRLMPHLKLEEELVQVFEERERLHSRVETWNLGRLLAAALRRVE